jgi:hypothetical protein
MYVSYVKYVIKNKSDEWKTEFRHLLLLKKCDFFQKPIVACSVCFGLSRARECVREVRLGLDWIGLGWDALGWVGLDWIGLEWNGETNINLQGQHC